MFRRLFRARGLKDLKNKMIVLKSRKISLLVKPSGFSKNEVSRIREHWAKNRKNKVKYAPGDSREKRKRWLKSKPKVFVPNDDKPYLEPIDIGGFELFPNKKQLKDSKYALSWIKVFTFLFFGTCTILAILGGQIRRRGGRRIPLALAAYFLVTGVSYMVTQIGLMAKLELFMGQPIYAISVVLASYLLANAGGAALVHRLDRAGRRPPIWLAALAAALCLLVTLFVVELYVTQLLWLPMWAKAPLGMLSCAPLAVILGMFYPLGVMTLVDRRQNQLVPFSFSLAALSSMLGGIWAMGAVINLGFSAVVLHAEIGYVAIALVSGGTVLIRKYANN
jgi:hypothetical protein